MLRGRFSSLGDDDARYRRERLGQFIRHGPPGLGHVRSPPAATAHHGRHLFHYLPGMEAGIQILGDHGQQTHFSFKDTA